MVDHGAQNLAIFNRSGTSPKEALILIDDLTQQGVFIRMQKCDVADKNNVRDALRMAAERGPIKGIIHAAVVLEDRLFSKLSFSEWRNGLRAKILGSIHLHETSYEIDLDLDFFTMTSSFMAVLPSDTAYHRRGVPLPAYMDHPLFASLRNLSTAHSHPSAGGSSISWESSLSTATTYEAVVMIVEEVIISKLSSLLTIPAEDIDPQKPLSIDGVDRFVSIEIRLFLSKSLNARIPVLDIVGPMSLGDVAKKVVNLSKTIRILEE